MENACPCHPQPRGDWWQRGLAMIILLWQVPGINPRSCCSHLTAFRGRLQLGTGSRPRFSQQRSFRCKEKTAWKNKSLSEGEKKNKFKAVLILIHQKERPAEKDGVPAPLLHLNLNPKLWSRLRVKNGSSPPQPFLLRARLSKALLVFSSRSLLKCAVPILCHKSHCLEIKV